MGLLFLGLLAFGCQDDDPVDPDPQPTETARAVIGPDGGMLQLSNGVRVVIPPGALSQEREITLHHLKPEDYFDGPTDYTYVIECLPEGQAMTKPVEIMFPVPEALAGRTDIDGLAGWIDPESNAVEVYPSTILSINDTAYLVMETNHFSKYTGEWYEYPPASASILEIPHYNQGNTPYCWAAGIQMICEAIKHDADKEFFNIIGQTGVDEGGLSQYKWRFGNSVANQIMDRTGLKPDRKFWPLGSASAMDGYLRDRVALGYPVLVHTPVEEHAFVVVGYDGLDFFIANPASEAHNGNLNYTKKPWSDFKTDQLELGAWFVTHSIPTPIQCADRLQTLNIPSGGLVQFRPKGGNYQQAINFNYDYTRQAGYTFRNFNNVIKDTIPGDMGELILKDIELANASRTQTAEYTVQAKVINLKEPTRSYYTEPKTVIVGPNSMGKYNEVIPVPDFQNTEVSPYILEITAWDGSGHMDEAKVGFTLAPPERTARLGLTIQVNVEDHGNNVYSLPFHSGQPTDHDPAEWPGGKWNGNEFLIDAYWTDGEHWIDFEASFIFNASKSMILSTTWKGKATYGDLITFSAKDIPVSLVNDKFVADLTGQAVCEKMTEIIYGDESINGDKILRYFCTDDAWLFIEIPK